MWDEIVQSGRHNLNCIVIGQSKKSGLITRDDIYSLADLEVIYTSSPKETSESLKVRDLTSNLSTVLVENIGTSIFDNSMYYFDDEYTIIPNFKKVALGGTFDCLHNGHKKLLTLAASICDETLVVGIMSDQLLANKKNAANIMNYNDRKLSVENFLMFIKPKMHLDIAKLLDPFGPTIIDESIEAIVVSSETIGGALKINSIRKEKGWQPLKIIISRRHDGASLSSTFIRERKGSIP